MDEKILNVVKGLPDYSKDEAEKVFMLGGYVAPHKGIFDGGKADYITEEAYAEMREAGLDYILTLHEQGPTNPDVIRHLELGEKVGVKVIVRWDGIIDQADMRTALKNIEKYESFWGILAKDEPSAELFEPLGKACEAFKEILPDKYFYVNLFPNYASNAQLAANSYEEYVERYCALIDNGMIIEDHYPYESLGNPIKHTVTDGYLSNLEVIQRYAKKYGREHWEYIQAVSCYEGHKVPDYYDFRHQIYTSMCFGVVNMQYFCYFTPDDQLGKEQFSMIDPEGKRTQRWYDAQKINAEIHKFDHVYLNFADNHIGVMTVIGRENGEGKQKGFELLKDSISSHERIKRVTAGQDTIIGAYKDGEGRDGFMVVNYSVPGNRLKDKVTIDFVEADAVVYYRKGEYCSAKLDDAPFEIELDAGEGIFIIPIKY